MTNRSQFVEAQSAAEHAFTLLQKNSKNYSLKEHKLIGAMKGRYISFTNQTVGYIRYRDLLAGGDNNDDPDVLTFLAEAHMVLHCNSAGYEFYDPSTGSPYPEIDSATQTLEQVLKQTSYSHPFAKHLYIHIVEPSHAGEPTATHPYAAGRAERASDSLEAQFKNSVSQHLQHMPGHIFLRFVRLRKMKLDTHSP